MGRMGRERGMLPLNPGESDNFQAELSAQLGCVANFAQEVVKGQWPLSVEGLSGQGVEQFGRSEALVSLLDHQLSFLDHVHEFDAGERGLSRVKRFEP